MLYNHPENQLPETLGIVTRRVVLTLLLTLGAASTLFADRYEIVKMNTPTITIGNKSLKEGDAFSDATAISWTANPQWLTVKNLTTGRITKFSRKQFEARNKAVSLKDFFLRSERASTRDANKGVVNFIESGCKGSFPDRRIALVIGNSNYSTLPGLRNPVNDASDITDRLLDLGFDVMVMYNGTYTEMRNALIEFADRGSRYDAAVFYYSGHGIQEEAQSYLVPTEAALEFRSEVAKCVSCRDVLDKLHESGCKSRIAFFDACRTKTNWNRGLRDEAMTIEGEPGTVILFSTRSEHVAQDGDGDNSPFATSLMKSIGEPISVPELTSRVVKQTYESTGSQYPSSQGALLTDFRFNPNCPTFDGQSVAAPATSATRSVASVASPNVSIDTSLYGATVSNYRRSGDRILFDVSFSNATANDMSVIFKSWPASQAFDDEGNNYRVCIDGVDIFTCHAGLKKKVTMYINHVPDTANSFQKINICLFVYDVNKTETHSNIQISDAAVR
jgi:hypothetical protein